MPAGEERRGRDPAFSRLGPSYTKTSPEDTLQRHSPKVHVTTHHLHTRSRRYIFVIFHITFALFSNDLVG